MTNEVLLYHFTQNAVSKIAHNDIVGESKNFHIKQISDVKFIVQENFKKKIVFLNEIFFIDKNMFVLIIHAEQLNLISPDPQGEFECSLVTTRFVPFLKALLLALSSIKITSSKQLIEILKGLLYGLILLFILSGTPSLSEESDKNQNSILQKNIYLGYQDILHKAVLFHDQKIETKPFIPIQKHVKATKKLEKKRPRKEPQDKDVQFFFSLKDRYAKP